MKIYGKITDKSIIYPGSFNYVHQGHILSAQFIEKKYSRPVVFEISISNCDKEDANNIEERVARINDFGYSVVVTNARTFAAKYILLRSAGYYNHNDIDFCCGVDTWNRILDKKYYFDSEEIMKNTLKNKIGSHFYILPRNEIKLMNTDLLRYTFCEDFKEVNISSSEIRKLNE